MTCPTGGCWSRLASWPWRPGLAPCWGKASLAAGLALCALAESAQAQDLNWTLCRGGQGIAQEGQVVGCSAVIQSRQESAKNRAYAYFIRAYVFAAQSDFDRAIVDL